MADTRYQDYNRLEKGDTTYFLFENLFYGPVFNKVELTKDDLMKIRSLEAKPAFLEGVAERLCVLGVDCSANDTSLIEAEIKRRYKERTGKDCPKTIKNWTKGKEISTKNRRNNYELCYALEMDIAETANFFMKYFLSLPFNYKDATDAIFFYCLMNQRPYSTIEAMLAAAENFQPTKDTVEYTAEIARQICDIDDDAFFMQYLSNHCYNEKQQYQQARKTIIRLMEDQCTRIKKWPKESRQGRTGSPTDIELCEQIMGFNYKERVQYGKSHFFPKTFADDLPKDQTLGNIKKGKTETYETLRKTLIILAFYDFYIDPFMSGNEPTESEIRERQGDFYDELNTELLKCGMVPLYERNLFDAVIVFLLLSS